MEEWHIAVGQRSEPRYTSIVNHSVSVECLSVGAISSVEERGGLSPKVVLLPIPSVFSRNVPPSICPSDCPGTSLRVMSFTSVSAESDEH